VPDPGIPDRSKRKLVESRVRLKHYAVADRLRSVVRCIGEGNSEYISLDSAFRYDVDAAIAGTLASECRRMLERTIPIGLAAPNV
jgi:hypothetical protein